MSNFPKYKTLANYLEDNGFNGEISVIDFHTEHCNEDNGINFKRVQDLWTALGKISWIKRKDHRNKSDRTFVILDDSDSITTSATTSSLAVGEKKRNIGVDKMMLSGCEVKSDFEGGLTITLPDEIISKCGVVQVKLSLDKEHLVTVFNCEVEKQKFTTAVSSISASFDMTFAQDVHDIIIKNRVPMKSDAKSNKDNPHEFLTTVTPAVIWEGESDSEDEK